MGVWSGGVPCGNSSSGDRSTERRLCSLRGIFTRSDTWKTRSSRMGDAGPRRPALGLDGTERPGRSQRVSPRVEGAQADGGEWGRRAHTRVAGCRGQAGCGHHEGEAVTARDPASSWRGGSLFPLRLPSRVFPFPTPGGFCGGEKGIWGSGRRTMLSRLPCAAPSPEGKRRTLQRRGRGASVVLPPLLRVVLMACEGTGGRGAGGRRPGAASGGLRAPIGRPVRTADPGIGSGAGLAASQPGSPTRPAARSAPGAAQFGGERLRQ